MCIALPSAGSFNVSVFPIDIRRLGSTDHWKIEFPPAAIVFRNQTITGTLVSSLSDIDQTLDFAKRGKLRLKPEVSQLSDVGGLI